LVIASSSRLFTAFLGARVSSNKKAPLFLDMRDLFRENMQEIIKNPLINYPLDIFLSFIEKYTFNKADRINIVSEGFRDFFDKFDSQISFYPNGIDEVFLMNDFSNNTESKGKRIITYAGNIGDGQGLHKIIPQTANLLKDTDYVFRIIGDGGTRHLLEKELNVRKITNVELIDPVNRDNLLNYYKETDYLFLHLNDYDAFKKVLPSKIFEYAATGKPMIAGVGGYAKEFLRENVEGLLLFEPCNENELAEALKSNVLPKDAVDRNGFINKFARSSIMNEMAEYILKSYRED
jgi:glycosyltransferase involved in cell wall biosynthesis